MDTILGQPLVREYLRALDEACSTLPYAQAQELHEQIAGHLEDALVPDADAATVAAELDRLGRPRALAAALAGPVPPSTVRGLRNRLARVRWWIWAVTGLVIAVLGTGSGFLISMNTAPQLIASGEIGWLYPADRSAAVVTTAGDETQTAVPYRFGHQQGIVAELVNDSDWTQRIVGVAPDWGFGALPGESHVSVEGGPGLNAVGADATGARPDHYTLPGVIPPHSSRLVHVWWTSNECMGANGGVGRPDIELLVRVGTINRTEDITLQDSFLLTGPRHAIIRNCQ
jgi:hypothetical protein